MGNELIIERVENTVNVIKPNNTKIVEIAQGLPGKGFPALGSEGNVLVKRSDIDYDTEWVDLTASDIALEDIVGVNSENVQTAIEDIAGNKTSVVVPLKLNGATDNTGDKTISIDMSSVEVETILQLTDKLLIQRNNVIKSITYDQLSEKGDSFLRGSINLIPSGNSGVVTGDPLNVTITEGTPPSINEGDPVVGVHYIVENTSVISSISGESLEYTQGDYVEWSGTTWVRIIRTLDEYVQSFNGRTRVVTPQTGDYSADQITNAADLTEDNAFQKSVTIAESLIVAGQVLLQGTGAMKIPTGTQAQRPVTPQVGYFRFNTDSDALEVYDGIGWLTIDPRLLEAAIQLVSDNLDTLELRVTANESAIADNASDISLLSGGLSGITPILDSLRVDVDKNTDDISVLDGRITANVGSIVGLEGRIDLNQSNITLVDAKADQNSADIIINENDIALNKLDIDVNTGLINDVNLKADGIDADLQATKVRVSDNEVDIGNNTSEITLLKGRVTQNETDIDANELAIAQNSADIVTNANAIIVANSNISANANNIQINSGRIDSNEDDIATNLLLIQGNSSRLDVLEAPIDFNEARVTQNEIDIAANKVLIDALDKIQFNWESGRDYLAGNGCYYNNQLYRCLQNSSGNQPDTSPTYWVQIKLSDILWQDSWTYSTGDMIWYVDSFYLCILPSTGDQPDTSPTYWDKQVSAPGTTWSSEATYGTDDLVWYSGRFWESLIDDNLGNTPVEGASWTEATILTQPVHQATCGEALTSPKLTYFGSDGKLYGGDNRELLKSIIAGCVVTSGVLDETVNYQSTGLISGFTGLTEGTVYYLGNSGNPITRGSILDGEQIVQIGIAKSATDLQLQIQPPQVQEGSWQNAEIADIKYSAIYADKTDKGWIAFGFDNAISQSVYSALFAKIGHMFNAQHVEAGDADLSGSSTLFYPTPVPGKYGRVGIPDIEFSNADVVDSGGSLRINNTNLHSTTRYGTAFKFEVISGTAPDGLISGAIYYGAFGEDYMLLHPTEADAIATVNRIPYTNSGSGTFRLTQEGVAIDDRSNSIKTLENGIVSGVNSILVPDDGSFSDYLFMGAGGSTRNFRVKTNGGETRGTTYYEFGYIKAESVTPSGEPVSALRYQEIISGSVWTGQTFTITHGLNAEIQDLLVKVEIKRDGDFEYQEVKGGLEAGDVSLATYGMSVVTTGSFNTFSIQTGSQGILGIDTAGDKSVLSSQAGSLRITVTKPNLIANYAYVPTVRTITDAVDVIESFPSASELIGERVYERTGSGTGKYTLNCQSGEVLVLQDGTEISSIDLEGEATLKVYARAGKLKVMEFVDVGSNSYGEWKKTGDGLMTSFGLSDMTTNTVVPNFFGSTSGSSYYTSNAQIFPLPFVNPPLLNVWLNRTSSNSGLGVCYSANITTSTGQLFGFSTGNGQVMNVAWEATGRWA